MASTSNYNGTTLAASKIEELKGLLWGKEIKCDVFQRWTQGFVFSEDEPTALVQEEGGPCAVIAPVQAFLLKNILFSGHGMQAHRKESWRQLSESDLAECLIGAFLDLFVQVKSSDEFTVLSLSSQIESEGKDSDLNDDDDGESSPKKRRLSHEQFHDRLSCRKCENTADLKKELRDSLEVFYNRYGVLLLLYSILLTKGIAQIKNEVEDLGEPLIDGIHGHGSQSMINLLLTGKAVSNVWDNEKEVSGLKLPGVTKQPTVGFLTQLEHLRYCEVGWYLKNPVFPIWLLGSETHLTVLFSTERNLVTHESDESAARRVFATYDAEECGFIQSEKLSNLLRSLDLVYEPPEYVKIMLEKLDPEQLGIVTLNAFMEEFYPNHNPDNILHSFALHHYNGLKRSCPDNKVGYQEGTANILETPELQLITDTSPMKTCLMTKWPTIELKWHRDCIPSLN